MSSPKCVAVHGDLEEYQWRSSLVFNFCIVQRTRRVFAGIAACSVSSAL